MAAAVIAYDGVERGDWERLLDSLAGSGSEMELVCLSWNGKGPKPPRWMRNSVLPVTWERLGWDDDFARQRNHSFSLVPEGIDWMFWIDTDDTLEFDAGDAFGRLFESLDPYTDGVFLRYDYSREPTTGKVVVEQWRERLFSTRRRWKWLFPLHEVCHSPPGTQFARRDQLWLLHHRSVDQYDHRTRQRNQRILAKALKKHPDEPRFLFYSANELYGEAQSKEGRERQAFEDQAMSDYRRFVELVPWEDDAYTANHRVADIQRGQGRFLESIETDLQGVKLRSSWPDSWNGLALSCLELGEWSRAVEWATISLAASSKPTTTQAIETMELTYIPHLIRGTALIELGRKQEALLDLRAASQILTPADLKQKIEKLEREIRPEKPAEDFSDGGHLISLDEERKVRRGTRPEKSIAFFTRPLWEPWHPKLEVEHGAGGAETCVMRLAARFAADGWRTVVFGTPGEHRGIDSDTGVEWWTSDEFLPGEPWTVFVSSRAPELFDADVQAKLRLLWMHDVNAGTVLDEGGMFGDRREQIDAIISLSHWHGTHLRRLYGLKQDPVVIPNGLELSHFAAAPEPRSAPRFVYSSSPDRGLDVLLGLWTQIMERHPGAELDIYYGWESIDKIIMVDPKADKAQALARFREYTVDLLRWLTEERGAEIRFHGRVPQRTLASELKKATVWTYPTFFCETHCITAMEMQAAGVIPVTSRLGALAENVHPDLQVPGWPNNESYHRDWLAKLDWVMEDSEIGARRRLDFQNAGRERALRYSWDNVYTAWRKFLEGFLEQKRAG